MILTKEDVQALKAADDAVVFSATYQGEGTYQGFIRAIKKVTTTGYNDATVDRDIPVDALLTTYHKPWAEAKAANASHVITGPSYEGFWQTITTFLRPGDDVTIHFIAGNNTPLLEEAGLTQDECALVVRRGKQRMAFHLDNRITRPTSPARMVRFE